VLVRQSSQFADLVEDLVRREEMWCATDLHLGPHIDSADGAREDDPVNRVIPAVDPAAVVGAHRLHGDTFILGIDDMLSLGNSADQKPPLSMKEPCIERDILSLRRQAEQVNAVLGDGQVIIVTRLID
jgi:hypothetical protein